MKHIAVAVIVSTLMVCDLLATEWQSSGNDAWGQWNTLGMVLAIAWFVRHADRPETPWWMDKKDRP